MLAVTTLYEVEADGLDIFRAAMIRQAEITRMREVGCQGYDVCFDPSIRTRCLAYAIFADEAAYDHHIATDHYRTFEDLIVDRIESQRVEFWNLVAVARLTGIKEM
jgi:quinol monooxygenase YgiN